MSDEYEKKLKTAKMAYRSIIAAMEEIKSRTQYEIDFCWDECILVHDELFQYDDMKEKEDEWIQFKEKMPNHNQMIKVKSDNLWTAEGIFQDGKLVYSWVRGACFGNPTHWSPIENFIEKEDER